MSRKSSAAAQPSRFAVALVAVTAFFADLYARIVQHAPRAFVYATAVIVPMAIGWFLATGQAGPISFAVGSAFASLVVWQALTYSVGNYNCATAIARMLCLAVVALGILAPSGFDILALKAAVVWLLVPYFLLEKKQTPEERIAMAALALDRCREQHHQRTADASARSTVGAGD